MSKKEEKELSAEQKRAAVAAEEKKKQDKQNMLSATIYFSFPFYILNNSNVLYPCSPNHQDIRLCFHKLS